MNLIEEGKRVFQLEAETLNNTANALDETFEAFVKAFLECEGKVVVIGQGKSGHVGRKISATLSSLGTPAIFLNPSEAQHGDLGVVCKGDIALLLSYSGECEDIIRIISPLKNIGAKLTAIVGFKDSTIAKSADLVQVLPALEEACHLGLAPTSSTTATLCYGDALAVTISKLKNFTKADFQKVHPGGQLGKK